MLVTKHLANKVFKYIDKWGETLSYIEWSIKDPYHHNTHSKPGQYVFGRDTIFNLASVVDW